MSSDSRGWKRPSELGMSRLGAIFILGLCSIIAVGAFFWSPWAGYAAAPLHGISFLKGCDSPTNVGEAYTCTFRVTCPRS